MAELLEATEAAVDQVAATVGLAGETTLRPTIAARRKHRPDADALGRVDHGVGVVSRSPDQRAEPQPAQQGQHLSHVAHRTAGSAAAGQRAAVVCDERDLAR